MKNQPNIQTPVSLNQGGTGADLSATGGSGQVLKQSTSGGAVSVSVLAAADMPTDIDAAKIGTGSVSNTEFGYLNGVTSSVQTQLDSKLSGTVAINQGGTGAITAADARSNLGTNDASNITTGTLPTARGGTGANLSATGGAGQVLKQSTSGGAVSVGALTAGDMPTGIDATRIGSGNVNNTQFSYLNGVTSSIQTQLNTKAATSHSHSLSTTTITGVLPVSKGGTGSTTQGGAQDNLNVPSRTNTYLYSIPLNPTSGAVLYRYTGTGQIHHLSSSKKSKSNIRNMEAVTEKLKALRPVRFDGIQPSDEKPEEMTHIPFFGLIAEEVATVLPDLCYRMPEEESNDPSGVHYDRIVTYLLAGWQEQQKIIEDLVDRLATLEK